MKFRGKAGAVLISLIGFLIGISLAGCERKSPFSEIVPERIIGRVQLPPLPGSPQAPADIGYAKAETTSPGNHRLERLEIPGKVNTRLPDFTKFKDTKRKKEEFFKFLYPIVLQENHAVLKERAFVLIQWQKVNNGKQPTLKDLELLRQLASKYRVDAEPSSGASFYRQMLLRIDMIPVELALIQAANESAWGTSYFARKGNNLFGLWCFTRGCGIVPRNRPEGARFEVRAFDDVSESVEAYILNLNTHPAYRQLRLHRYVMRLQGQQPDAHLMAEGLKRYSEIGMEYVKTVRQMIRGNRDLMEFDKHAGGT